MRIATYNINGIKARLPRLLEWLTETQPDIVCLQELKTSDETFPEKDIRDIGYGCIWHGQKGFNGVAILASGADPVDVKRGLAGEPDADHSSSSAAWRVGEECVSTCRSRWWAEH